MIVKKLALISGKLIICKWFVSAHNENILKQSGQIFFKTTGNAWKYLQVPRAQTNFMKDIPSFMKIGHCVLIREAKVYLRCWQETYIHLYRQHDNWNLSGPSSIAGSPQSVIEACSYFFFQGGSQKC